MLSEHVVLNIVQEATQETGKTANELSNEEMLLVIAKSIHRTLQDSKESDFSAYNDRSRSMGHK